MTMHDAHGRRPDTSSAATALSPTPRTTLRRNRARAQADRAALTDVLDAARICHLGVVVQGSPLVVPTAFAYDLDGPDAEGTLYLHGSVAATTLGAPGDVCVSITVLDGLVLARSAFHHSMNYRSAVVRGTPRVVDDEDERAVALDLIVNKLVPGRTDVVRANTRKELSATRVVALPLYEASVKARSGGPNDDEGDIDAGGVWAGVLPLTTQVGVPVPAADLDQIGAASSPM
ncbi:MULTISPECIES: pyridoxamine 5'-phosphate oxidase family protein [Nocardiaceae]|uniref:Nitroimidazol reductase NimA-like FMN-containing flavoprotein (Pyridoxamine 5'-phosphate oxidase superfamily) n=1 Tax=Rhodococcoides corynebacterioides TaxID=53972 RepID=A0ABS2KUW7_9NOCA|nr:MULTISPECIES: pyridoxamine 5'-phosphate oxidase family protein [Rhodococcus]MBM7415611.1 nitroimidazol reductase NimA-like FMN-containing flavoprotein (pyridoxamine 5'-phosphate oxidase superfamily) [Rhodococcus corynebacterioides]MBP1118073.1 nitroimidazol reductase NimA-like FMN-containing flavoprotein (pyridoxamine 5'-phosphate oxidase superfamily) [Rhodococcus sp. PvP016]